MPSAETSRGTKSSPVKPGFTLIELLLVIGIIAILAGIVVSSINPSYQLAGARNAQRWSDTTTLLDGFAQYAIDHYGDFAPQTVDGSPIAPGCSPIVAARKICKVDTSHGMNAGQCGDAGNECVWSRHLSGTYLVEIPSDPRDDETTATEQLRVDYTLRTLAGGRIEVSAPNAEQNILISKSQ